MTGMKGITKLTAPLRQIGTTSMTREIKFRAWDKTEKWIYLGFGSMVGLVDGCLRRFYSTEEGLGHKEYSDSYVLMQYTGLKDKNGKEIYEGDVVRHDNMIFKVEYHELFAGFKLVGDYDPPSDIVDIDKWNCEVIGNIHENKELLE